MNRPSLFSQGPSAPPPDALPTAPSAALPTAAPSPAPDALPSTAPTAPQPDALPSAGPGTLQPDPPPAGPGTRPAWGWLGIGVLAGLALSALAAAAALGIRRARRKRQEKQAQTPRPGAVTVQKLHEQGARASQQDSFSVSPEELLPTHGLLAVVADGMGGLADGDRVSQAAVSAFMEGLYAAAQPAPEQLLPTLLAAANRAVNALLGPEGLRRSGCTLAAGLLRDGMFYYLSVGDSRICLLRDGALLQLNREHLYRNELILRAVNGEGGLAEAEALPGGGGLTSFLGMGRLPLLDLPAQPLTVRSGDRLILMSDGVYNALSEPELTAALSAPDAAGALRAAIAAKAYANQDNYTAVILHCA